MRHLWVVLAAVTALTMVACKDDPVEPEPEPDSQTMSFKSGARYEYTSYSTDAEDGSKMTATERTRTWTLAQTNASVQGETGVAIYIDSVFNVGGVIDVTDSVYLRQESGKNDIYRYASLAPELDFSGVGVLNLESSWMHEAKLKASSAAWLVGRAQDTIDYDPGITGITVEGLEVAVTDSAVASAMETITIGSKSYETTKTTHKMILSVTALVKLGPSIVPLELKTFNLERISWMSHELGAIVREQREGTVVDATLSIPNFPAEGVELPIPGYYLEMTGVLSTGG